MMGFSVTVFLQVPVRLPAYSVMSVSLLESLDTLLVSRRAQALCVVYV